MDATPAAPRLISNTKTDCDADRRAQHYAAQIGYDLARWAYYAANFIELEQLGLIASRTFEDNHTDLNVVVAAVALLLGNVGWQEGGVSPSQESVAFTAAGLEKLFWHFSDQLQTLRAEAPPWQIMEALADDNERDLALGLLDGHKRDWPTVDPWHMIG